METNKNKKIGVMVLLIFILFLTISFTNAESIGLVKQNTEVKLFQTCNNCTYCNFTSIKYPNKSIILRNVETVKDETHYNYNLSGGNTSALGEYDFCYDCGNTVERSTGCNQFTVTPSGRQSSTGESLLYALFTVILFGILSVIIYFIIVLPMENEKNGDGIIIGILKLKYLKIFLIAIAYPITIVLLNLMTGLAVNFVTLSIFAGTIGFLFTTMLRLAWPFTVIIMLWIIILLVKDSNVKRNIDKLGRFKFKI